MTYASTQGPSSEFPVLLRDKISWGAILAGVVFALVGQLILNMIGIAVGAGSIDAHSGEAPAADRFSIVAALWWTISGIIAAFIGGFAAGRLCGVRPAWHGAWHGAATWALTTLLIVYLLGTALGGVIGGALGAVSQVASKVTDIAGEGTKTAIQAAAPASRRQPIRLRKSSNR